MAAATAGFGNGMDLEELKLLIEQQGAGAASAGASFLLKNFHDLLAALVGAALAGQLIGPSPDGNIEPVKAP